MNLNVQQPGGVMNETTTIAVDLAKNVFEVLSADANRRILERRRLTRGKFLELLARHEPVEVVMEACGSAHFWGRTARSFGHQPILLPPAQVKPYVLRNKTDRTDTTGLLEARHRPDIREIPVKTEHQQTLMALHRLRQGWVATRTSRISAVRGILREFGIVVPQGARFLAPRLADLLGDPPRELGQPLLQVLAEAREEILELERKIRETERQLKALAAQAELVERLLTIPGIGLLTATALVAYVGELSRFPSSRHLASFLGLTPREYSSAGTRRLGRITKRGNRYLRMLLIHGARAALLAGKRVENPDRLRAWALALEARSHHNQATVALANKLARIAWALATHQTVYQPERAA
jgi:transposase